ncbi:MAG: polyamine aminopropyltransferase [Phycisphaerales bacterium]|nr:polyamine aminopropyltransferase [Hyphomonadaceae bacterium]
MAKTFTEKLHKGYAQTMTLRGKLLADEKSQFQSVKMFDSERNGRVLVLDDIVQLTTRDECAYSEMLTHLPIFEHGNVKRVMIVGGGDIAIAEEALKHKDVEAVDMVEIDPVVIELSKQHLQEVNGPALKDKRLKIHVEDAFKFLGRKSAKQRYDLIIADRPDPVGPAMVLFGDTFYTRVRDALAPGGFACMQNGVPFYQPDEMTDTLRQMGASFKHHGVYLTVVPTYIGGYMALTWASNDAQLGVASRFKDVAKRFKAAKIKTDYYTPDMHAAAYALPPWIQRLIPSGR